MIACAPLFDRVHGSDRDALVEAAGGKDVIELNITCRLWALAAQVVRDDVAGVLRFARRPCLRLPTIRRLRSDELKPDGLHPLEHGPVACLPVSVSAIVIAVLDVDIAGR